MSVNVHICVCMFVCMCVYVCMCVHVCVYVCACVCVCVYMYIYAYACVFVLCVKERERDRDRDTHRETNGERRGQNRLSKQCVLVIYLPGIGDHYSSMGNNKFSLQHIKRLKQRRKFWIFETVTLWCLDINTKTLDNMREHVCTLSKIITNKNFDYLPKQWLV